MVGCRLTSFLILFDIIILILIAFIILNILKFSIIGSFYFYSSFICNATPFLLLSVCIYINISSNYALSNGRLVLNCRIVLSIIQIFAIFFYKKSNCLFNSTSFYYWDNYCYIGIY